jgi:hypothetical protein
MRGQNFGLSFIRIVKKKGLTHHPVLERMVECEKFCTVFRDLQQQLQYGSQARRPSAVVVDKCQAAGSSKDIFFSCLLESITMTLGGKKNYRLIVRADSLS